jgi:hypothetical protein
LPPHARRGAGLADAALRDLTTITGGIEVTDPVTRAPDPEHDTDVVTRATDPGQEVEVSRETLAQLDEAATSGQHWKILLTSGMGFFADAYDLFIIGVVATMITNEWHIASYQKSLCPRWRCSPRRSARCSSGG